MDTTRWHGTWVTEGSGSGRCPGGRGVEYDERLTLVQRSQHVHYHQIAIERGTGFVLHEESAVLRDGTLSLVMSSGRMELGRYAVQGDTLVLESETFVNDRKGVIAVRRAFELTPLGCAKTLWLATPVWPELTRHMHGNLVREPSQAPA
ncbi:MAG: hypothetical protein H6737_23455 [Alphaproteobacteria bacterium]|nr:hypothetical protein [Alphaproteobacteria bacterium]